MLVDYQYLRNKKKLLVSYINKEGDIKFKYYDWDAECYIECDEDDPNRDKKYLSVNKRPVKKIKTSNPDKYAIYEFLDSLPENEKKEIFEFNETNVFFIDIETEIKYGFPDPVDAKSKILSISIVFKNNVLVLGLKDLSNEEINRMNANVNEYFKKYNANYKIKYVKYNDEFDMLYTFFYKLVPKMPLLTGWNFLNFDWIYLVNRSRKLVKKITDKSGKTVEVRIDPSVSSFTKRLERKKLLQYKFNSEKEDKNEFENENDDYKNNEVYCEIPLHRIIIDYMQLYEILDKTIKVKESSSLDYVSNKLIEIEKIKYHNSIHILKKDLNINGYLFKEGSICRNRDDDYYMYYELKTVHIKKEDFESIKDNFTEIFITDLQKLYDNDYEFFIYYNIVDTILVQKIHETNNYLSIIFAISELAKISVKSIVSYNKNSLASLAISEGVLRNKFRDIDNVVFFKQYKKNNENDFYNEYENDEDSEDEEGALKGGWVKEPVTGLSKYVACYDFASLYPTTEMQFFISPETFLGILLENDTKTNTGIVIDKDKHVVCCNGAVFEKRKSPTLTTLENIYADRKKFKKIMLSKKEELKNILDEIKKIESEYNF